MVELKAPVVAFFYFVVRKHTGFDKILWFLLKGSLILYFLKNFLIFPVYD